MPFPFHRANIDEQTSISYCPRSPEITMTSIDSAVTVHPSDRTMLPGYCLPLSQDSHLPRAVDSWNANPITVRERMMISVMVTLKDKPEWHRKVFDEQIVAKWRTEAMQFGSEDSQEHGSEDEDRDQQQNGQSTTYFGAKRQETVSERMFELVGANTRRQMSLTQVLTSALVYCRAPP